MAVTSTRLFATKSARASDTVLLLWIQAFRVREQAVVRPMVYPHGVSASTDTGSKENWSVRR